MLRRLKAQVTQVANELPDLLNNSSSSSAGDRESALTSPSSGVSSMEDGREGFLCPMCMTSFQSPDILSAHFERAHAETASVTSVENPNFTSHDDSLPKNRRASSYSQHSFSSKDKEIEELRQQIKDEKWFSTELKKELDRIQSVVAQSQDVPKEEVPYLMQQIQMLEAGKSMVTQRMLEVEKESNGLRRSLDSVSQEKKEIMDRLKMLTEKVRLLTDENEEKKVENVVACEELIRVKKAMADLESEVDKLTKTLDQRPSEDDVDVLRKELIHAQQLMDEITQQKEQDIRLNVEHIRELTTEKERSKLAIEELRKQISEMGSDKERFSKDEHTLVENLNVTTEQFEEAKKEIEKMSLELAENSSKRSELEQALTSSRLELEEERSKIKELEDTVCATKRIAEDARAVNEDNEKKRSELNIKLQQVLEAKKQSELNGSSLEAGLAEQETKIKLLETANQELIADLASTRSQLEKERLAIQNKAEHVRDAELKLQLMTDSLEEVKKQLQKKEDELKENAALTKAQQQEISTLSENSKELLTKISEGEGGAKMAIDQLNAEKLKLLDDNKLLGDSLKEVKQEYEERISILEKNIRDKERERVEMERSKRDEVKNWKDKFEEAEQEINKKVERFTELEHDADEERKKATERLKNMKDVIQSKEAALEESKASIEQLRSEVASTQSILREKEQTLGDNKEQIEQSLEKIKQAEEKARHLENELLRVEGERSVLSKSETTLQCHIDQLNAHVAEYKEKISKLGDDIAEKDETIATLKAEALDKERHTAAKVSSLEAQLEEDHKANDDLLNTVNEQTAKIEALSKEKDSLETRLKDEMRHSEELSARIQQLETVIETEKTTKAVIDDTVKQKEAELDETRRLLAEFQERTNFEKDRADQAEQACTALKSAESAREETYNARVSELETFLIEAQQSMSGLQEAMGQKEKDLSDASGTIHRLTENMRSREQELEDFKIRVVRFEEQMSSEKRRIEQLEIEKNDEEQRRKSDGEKLQARLQALSVEMDMLRQKSAEQYEEHSKLQEKYASLNSQLISERDESRLELETRQEELDKMQRSLEEAKDSSMKKEGAMEEEISSLKRTVDSLNADFTASAKDTLELKQAVEELSVKNSELIKQVSSWEEEKNALIERCLNTESDLDFERERAMENKRRFDNALSAMHELGRANQSLQMDMSKQLSRKWLDDSEAVNCTACGKVFSLTVRKHHCRVCGLIFCGSCSNHTVKIASHKNPVRVCEPCLQEVANR